jgi:NAD+ synthase (glutamine-hydrolysing)
MRLMLVQMASRVGDLKGNRERIVEALAHAKKAGCDLAVFPELAVTGYPPEDLLLRPAFMDAVEREVATIIEATGKVAAVFGFPRRVDGGLRNCAVLAADGVILGTYDKRALPNYGVFDERRYFEPGTNDRDVFAYRGWHIGIGICEDLWHDDLAQKSTAFDCDVRVNLNASPFHVGKQDEREALIRHRAAEFGVPVAYVNPVGGQDEVVFDGGSHVMDPSGVLLGRSPLFAEAELIVDLDRPGRAEVAAIPERMAQVYAALVLGIRDYVLRNGCRQVLLGLSGGIDSAVTAVLAVDALGAENVLGVLMPSRYSSEHSVHDAEDLAQNLGIETVTLPIESPVAATETLLAPVFAAWGKDKPDVTEENVQARIRGLLQMAISNKTGRMLLTTGNKSEMAVGYATLYGDMAGGFAVLKDVYKTEVYELAQWLNRRQGRIPERSITKEPSAELRADQRDADSLPPYPVLDAILTATIEGRESVEQIAARGFPVEDVRRIVRMVHAAEYKRRQAPPGVKITPRAFGRDRRYPITHAFRE